MESDQFVNETPHSFVPLENNVSLTTVSLKVCRTCMCPSDLRPLFPQADKYHSFVRALYLSTGLQIELNDGLPQSICRNCAKIIESAMRFRSQSQSTEQKLLQCFNFNKNTGFDGKPNSIKEDETTSPEIKTEEENRESHVVEIENMKCKKNKNYETGDTNEINNEAYNSQSEDEDILITQKTTNSNRPYLDLIEGPVVNKGPITCKICKKNSKTINAFEKHALSHMGYEILCEFCARRCLSIHQLLRHQRAKHGLARDNSFACSYCDFQALDKEQLESHERRIHTKERPYVCDECGEAFYTKRVLIQHGYCHKTEKPFECNLCPSKFKIRSRLTSHKNFVHSKRYKYTYGCYICPKTYKKPYEARKHILKIHGIPKDQQSKIPRYNRDEM